MNELIDKKEQDMNLMREKEKKEIEEVKQQVLQDKQEMKLLLLMI